MKQAGDRKLEAACFALRGYVGNHDEYVNEMGWITCDRIVFVR